MERETDGNKKDGLSRATEFSTRMKCLYESSVTAIII